MTKEELIKDSSFRHQCSKYGLNWNEDIITITEDTILLHGKENILISFDRSYNTISIESNIELKNEEEINYYTRRKYNDYSSLNDGISFGKGFEYPFEKYTLKDIINISNKIEIKEINHAYFPRVINGKTKYFSTIFKINDQWYVQEAENDYLQLLAYIKFLGEELKRYFLYSYKMQILGFKVPNPNLYIGKLIQKMNEIINYYVERKQRLYTGDILSYINPNCQESNYEVMLYNIIDLLIRNKGMKIKDEHPDQLEIIKNSNPSNLSATAIKLFEILNVLSEDKHQKEDFPVRLIKLIN